MAADTFGKDAWVELYREIGLDDAALSRWHAAFERRWPEDHQRFLEWLGLAPAEVAKVRAASRAGR